jgi:arginine repressor
MAMPITIDPVVKGKRRPRRVSKTKRSMGPAGASTVSKDGKRMKTTKTPTAKQKQLQKLRDMRSKVMGTQKVMTAAMGGQAKASKKRAMSEAERRRFMERLKKGPGKPKVATPIDKMKRKGLAGLVAGAAKGAGKAAGKGLKGALAKLTLKGALAKRKKQSAAAEAFKKAKARKPGGRLTADDLRRATRSR